MTPKRHIGRLLKECHKLNEHRHLEIEDALLRCGDVELAIYELQKTLEKGENYEMDNRKLD